MLFRSLLPSPRPRRALPRRVTHFLIIEDQRGAWLLERRPPSGIWGGLWSFPEFSDLTACHTWCTTQDFVLLTDFKSLPAIEHTFTHFHLSITPQYAQVRERAVRCMDSEQWLWYNNAAPAQVGLAKPVGELIDNLQRLTQGI